MTVLALRLAGPLQAWGASSRFTRRTTEHEPTKSGVIGLLAAAQGRRRTEPLTELAGLSFGVRVDQPGTVLRDFQVARSLDGRRTMPVSERYYLQDAAFLAVLEGDETLLERLDRAVRRPTFLLYLGRRSCPPAGPVSLGVRTGNLGDALRTVPWQAADWYQRRRRHEQVELETVTDAAATETDRESRRDEALSFEPTRREYGWRFVHRSTVPAPPGRYASPHPAAPSDHDPFAALGA